MQLDTLSAVYCASVTRHNKLQTVLKRTCFMIDVIDGVLCVKPACDKHTQDAFQLSHITGVKLWPIMIQHCRHCDERLKQGSQTHLGVRATLQDITQVGGPHCF